jgi:hypothetical protein
MKKVNIKMLIALGVMVLSILLVCIFSNISSLYASPLQTPAEFLASMPYITMTIFGQSFILIQPSSTFFVYFLGIVMIVIGILFIKNKENQNLRFYWGIGLILWGISAIVAGTSYQAFGYELKCRGQEYCLFTSNWELVYMLLTAYCINGIVVATGFTSTNEKGRKLLIKFAIIDSIAYSIYMLIGCIVPNQFMISYEGFMAFIGLNFVLMFVLYILHYKKYKDKLNKNLIIIMIGFMIVNLGYFIYLLGGFATPLYENYGIWFNANDVLHILLTIWTVLIYCLLRKSTDCIE